MNDVIYIEGLMRYTPSTQFPNLKSIYSLIFSVIFKLIRNHLMPLFSLCYSVKFKQLFQINLLRITVFNFPHGILFMLLVRKIIDFLWKSVIRNV